MSAGPEHTLGADDVKVASTSEEVKGDEHENFLLDAARKQGE